MKSPNRAASCFIFLLENDMSTLDMIYIQFTKREIDAGIIFSGKLADEYMSGIKLMDSTERIEDVYALQK